MKYTIEQDTTTDRFTATVSDLGVERLCALQQHLNAYWGVPPLLVMPESFSVELASMDQFISLIFRQNRILGIKMVRTITGWGLFEARQYCERLANYPEPNF